MSNVAVLSRLSNDEYRLVQTFRQLSESGKNTILQMALAASIAIYAGNQTGDNVVSIFSVMNS